VPFAVGAVEVDLRLKSRGIGLSPSVCPGKTKKKAFIHGGRAKVRKCLYMAAQSAATHNPVIKAYVSKLINRGKPYKSPLFAAMRKLLICMQSLSKNLNFVLE
jgi:transposase